MPGGNKKVIHTQKTCSWNCKFAYVCVAFLLPPDIKRLKTAQCSVPTVKVTLISVFHYSRKKEKFHQRKNDQPVYITDHATKLQITEGSN